ncbi:hypothetical protein D3C83_234360 [compost metagenome]
MRVPSSLFESERSSSPYGCKLYRKTIRIGIPMSARTMRPTPTEIIVTAYTNAATPTGKLTSR